MAGRRDVRAQCSVKGSSLHAWLSLVALATVGYFGCACWRWSAEGVALTCARDQPTPRPPMVTRAVPATTRRIATVAIDRPPPPDQARTVQVVCVVFSDHQSRGRHAKNIVAKVTECALIWMHRVAYSSLRECWVCSRNALRQALECREGCASHWAPLTHVAVKCMVGLN
jgi:hypothetical protein